ncbi:hypothetical protein I2900191A2_23810 [Intestinibacter bartlettii]|uniref:DUF262 domain-containing protein n=1 Tax=Intestinibacter bartlettii TaxID=261299 RepID=UPI0034ABADF3
MIRINNNLQKFAGVNPTKKTFQMSVVEMCEHIDSNEITLPLYQRDVSWTLRQCVDLFNYQLLGPAPVAPISMNQISNTIGEVYQISFISRELVTDIKNKHLSVIDGQQRTTANFKAYDDSPELRSVVLDLIKGKFLINEGAIKKHQIPIGKLLNRDNTIFHNYVNASKTLSKPECMSLLFQIRNKLRDYNYTINLAEDLTEDEQINWFEVLNNAGSKVTRIQMQFSKLKVKDIDIYKDYTNVFNLKIEGRGYDSLYTIKPTEVSIPVAALNSSYEVVTKKDHTPNFTPIPSDVRETQLCALASENTDKLIQCFNLTLQALDTALDFIEDNNLKQPSRIDYITYLTGLFTFYDVEDLTDTQIDEIIHWYNNVSFLNMSNGERRKEFTKLLTIPELNFVQP